jgi:hypothetical protein
MKLLSPQQTKAVAGGETKTCTSVEKTTCNRSGTRCMTVKVEVCTTKK